MRALGCKVEGSEGILLPSRVFPCTPRRETHSVPQRGAIWGTTTASVLKDSALLL